MQFLNKYLLRILFLTICSLPIYAATLPNLPAELIALVMDKLDVDSIINLCATSNKIRESCQKYKNNLFKALVNRDFDDAAEALKIDTDFKALYERLFDEEVKYFKEIKKIREMKDPTWVADDAKYMKSNLVDKVVKPQSLENAKVKKGYAKDDNDSGMELAYEFPLIEGLKRVFGDRPTIKYFIKKFKVKENE